MVDWEDVGYVLASQLRIQALRILRRKEVIPSKLAQMMERSRSTVSTLLKGLGQQGLVTCLNPERRKGRIYAITDIGREVLGRAERVLSEED